MNDETIQAVALKSAEAMFKRLDAIDGACDWVTEIANIHAALKLSDRLTLPLMSRATFRQMWESRPMTVEVAENEVTCNGIRYRIADTDENGLLVAIREPDMPEWAKYRSCHANSEWYYHRVKFPHEDGEIWQRIEDFGTGGSAFVVSIVGTKEKDNGIFAVAQYMIKHKGHSADEALGKAIKEFSDKYHGYSIALHGIAEVEA